MATLAAQADVELKAGANASALTSGQYDSLIEQAEGAICTESQYNWVDDYASLNDDFRQILLDAASAHAAISAINYDMSGFTSRAEAQVMIDVNIWRFNNAMKLLKESQYRDFVQEAA